jgi:type IV secretion system protein VirB1
MKAPDAITAVFLLAGASPVAGAQTPAQPLPFEKLAAECAPDVHPATLKSVVSTESSWNPYAIGVVGARLDRQPRNLAEAVATARDLERKGFNFSLGLGQVNRYNLSRYGETVETVFDPCRNLRAGSAILKNCYQHAKARISDEQQALRAAFSCYYSGNFTRGFYPDKTGQASYVQKVVANTAGTVQPAPIVPAIKPLSGDAAPVQRVDPMPVVGGKKRKATPSQWVIFANAAQQGKQAAAANEGAPDHASVKVQFTNPDSAPASAPPQQNSDRDRRQVREVPFVQFVN